MAASTVMRLRTLPFTCTGTSMVSAASSDGSASGNGAYTTVSVLPSFSHSSSAKCGTSGASSRTSTSATKRGVGPLRRVSSLFSSVMRAMAELKRKSDMASVTASMVR